MKDGDANTTFFPRTTSMRRRHNTIHSLVVGNRTISDEDNMQEHIHRCFKKIFGEQKGSRFNLMSKTWGNDMDLYGLEKDFFKEEIKRAIWNLGVDQASGPNEYPIFFFEKLWESIKEDITNLVIEIGEGTATLYRINYSQIVLIPKKENPITMRDFQLVALLNSSFKIISKILTNRLSPVIREMNRDYQTGFMKGRSILQGIAIAKEVIHQY